MLRKLRKSGNEKSAGPNVLNIALVSTLLTAEGKPAPSDVLISIERPEGSAVEEPELQVMSRNMKV